MDEDKQKLVQLVWLLVRMRGGTVVVPDAVAVLALNPRNRLHTDRDAAGNMVLRAECLPEEPEVKLRVVGPNGETLPN